MDNMCGEEHIHNNMDVFPIWMDIIMCREENIHNNMFPPGGEARMWNLVIVLKVAMLEM